MVPWKTPSQFISSLFLVLPQVSLFNSRQYQLVFLIVSVLYLSTLAADFTPLSESLTFSKGGRQCVNIGIVTGDALEDVEKFSVVLTTQDERLR